MAKSRILIVDDEPKIADVLKSYLEREGFGVANAINGEQAIERTTIYKPDLMILDLNLPDMDGLEVFRTVRKEANIPIIMLTGRGEEVDRIVGLELGADDYVTKPFSAREVVARVKAVLRRNSELPNSDIMTIGGLTVGKNKYTAHCQNQKLDLTTTEFKLLAALVGSPGKVFSRAQLLDVAQGIDYEGYERTIDAHIKNIRQKINSELIRCNCQIETVRGVGYKLEVDADAR